MKRLFRLLSLLYLAVVISIYAPHVQAADLLVSSDTAVKRYDGATGTFIGDFASGLNIPEGLTFGPDGNLYVSDYYGYRIQRFDGTTGAFIDCFVCDAFLLQPRGLTFGPDGDLYVTNAWLRTVERYDGMTGAFKSTFVPFGSGGLDGPFGLIFNQDGDLLVASFESGEVLKYNGTTGAFIGVFASMNDPADLTFGPDGNLYVTSTVSNSVEKFDGVTGAHLASIGTAPDLNFPIGLAFGSDSYLYVANWLGLNVVRYDVTTGAFLGEFIPTGSGGLGRPRFLIFTPQESTPVCDIQMNQATYTAGDTVTANVFRVANPGADPICLEWKVWLGMPSSPPVSMINMGTNGTFCPPAGFELNLSPLALFPAAGMPLGSYEFSCRMLDPVTGELLAEDLNPFDIQ